VTESRLLAGLCWTAASRSSTSPAPRDDRPAYEVADPDAPVGLFNHIFSQGKVIVVWERGEVRGLITKIDVIDYLAHKRRDPLSTRTMSDAHHFETLAIHAGNRPRSHDRRRERAGVPHQHLRPVGPRAAQGLRVQPRRATPRGPRWSRTWRPSRARRFGLCFGSGCAATAAIAHCSAPAAT
jgi:hypothetical protein